MELESVWIRIPCNEDNPNFEDKMVWLHENCKGPYYHDFGSIMFSHNDDIILYKLRWGYD